MIVVACQHRLAADALVQKAKHLHNGQQRSYSRKQFIIDVNDRSIVGGIKIRTWATFVRRSWIRAWAAAGSAPAPFVSSATASSPGRIRNIQCHKHD